MKPASPKIIPMLQGLYFDETVAENQYLSHYAVAKERGIKEFAAKLKERAHDERKHKRLIGKLLARFGVAPAAFGGKCDAKIGTETDCPAMLATEGELEATARERYEAGIRLCVEDGDNDTREILVANLGDEVDHGVEIDQDAGLIEDMGIDNWLSTMV